MFPVPKLLVADRCDQCTAQALVRLSKGQAVLDFCGHHYGKNELALIAQGFEIGHDVRGTVK